MATPRRGATLGALLLPVLLILAACGGSGGGTRGTSPGSTSSTSAGMPKRGGSITVLEDKGFAGDWSMGLDPATGGGSIAQAIFGGLFVLRAAKGGGGKAEIVPNQAESGTLSPDGKTLTIKLRPGIEFSDGTPLNAKAVIWNFKRDTNSTCTCAPQWKLRKKDPFTSPDPLTVVVHMTVPDAALLHNFPASNLNNIASPTAVKKMGTQAFKLKPVGAGPFVVVSDKLSTKLVLKRNPNFFKKGKPYLDGLTFESIGGDQPAYQAMLAGQADAFEGMTTPPVIKQAESNSKLRVTLQPGTSPYMVHFNTMIPPFNNIKAREAVIYATNWAAISKGLFDGKPQLVQGFTTPVDLYYHRKTPGYRTFDLDKAKALVKKLGGLSFQLDTTAVYTATEVMKALQTQWEKAGMKIKIKAYQINNLVKRYNSGKWQTDLATAGAWDPGAGVGIGFRFSSTSPFTGVKDKHLDTLLRQSVATAVDAQRDKVYQEIAKYISDKAYAEFGFAFANANVVRKGVHGTGLTTAIPALLVNTQVIWSEVWTDDG